MIFLPAQTYCKTIVNNVASQNSKLIIVKFNVEWQFPQREHGLNMNLRAVIKTDTTVMHCKDKLQYNSLPQSVLNRNTLTMEKELHTQKSTLITLTKYVLLFSDNNPFVQ